MERSRLLVAASVPEGCVLAPRVSVWLEAVREVAEARGLRDVQVVTVVRVARGLCDWVDGASRTTRVVNERVAELAGCCVRTVQRWLRRLERWGLLGLVAGGRSARWAPLARSQDAEGRVVLERRNEAAVRSLVVPEAMVAAAPALASSSSAGRGPVDNEGPAGSGCGSRCHPYPLLGILDPRTRARGGLGGKGLVPLRGAEAILGAAARPGGRVRGNRRRAWWSPRRTRSTEEAVLGLARELQERMVVLRGCSDRYVMRVIKAFGEAGWSVGDLVAAVDRRPDGSAWPHSGDRGVREPARWLIHRLSAWIDDRGAPRLSWRQERQAAHERAMAEREARMVAREAERARIAAQRASWGGGPGPGQLAARRAAMEAAGRSGGGRHRWRGR
ncbi:hypothetical protein BKH13_12840 [Actinomyces naeslundii]|uniref:Uncharacterized protein n=2 Tax=Actinomyces naeslundii TaxID=1655 RepID=A0ABX3EY26_ACTNA|nr:hypothetical protein BKH13_12840 [Actinomyces naeslundii]